MELKDLQQVAMECLRDVFRSDDKTRVPAHIVQAAVAVVSVQHYGSHGMAECGAHGDGKVNEALLTLSPDDVTCKVCRGWLPIVVGWKPGA